MMHSETMQVSDSLNYSLIISVSGEDVQMHLDVEEGDAPDSLKIQEVLLMMCMQIRNELDEERDQNRLGQDDSKN